MKKMTFLPVLLAMMSFTVSFTAKADNDDHRGCCKTLSAGATSTSTPMINCEKDKNEKECMNDRVNKCGWNPDCGGPRECPRGSREVTHNGRKLCCEGSLKNDGKVCCKAKDGRDDFDF